MIFTAFNILSNLGVLLAIRPCFYIFEEWFVGEVLERLRRKVIMFILKTFGFGVIYYIFGMLWQLIWGLSVLACYLIFIALFLGLLVAPWWRHPFSLY